MERENFAMMQREAESAASAVDVLEAEGRWIKLRKAVHWLTGRENATPEVATVLDGTILRDVYLVGTTARTATFFQVCTWGPSGPDREFAPEVCKLGGEDAGGEGRGTDSSGGAGRKAEFVQGGRVLTMDRALVVCLAKGNACTDQGPMGKGGSDGNQLSEVGLMIEAVAKSRELDELSGEIDGRLNEIATGVDQHLNRHHGQILRILGGSVAEAAQ